MPDKQSSSSIFNRQARERLNTPDDLDRYVRVTKPSVWVVLTSVLVLTLGLLAWGVFGSVSSSVSAMGTCIDGQVICLIGTDQVVAIEEGDPAYVGGQIARVAEVGIVPISRDEASKIIASDYLVETLMTGNWAYLVTLEGADDVAENVPLAVSITTDRIAPISLVLG